ncbi:MAG TPA: response regulator, partial [Pirellulales bacterium]
RSLDRAQGGLGIGLTLVRALTEQHGGAVEAHSEGRGKGSEFVVRLPLAPSDDPDRPVESVIVGAPPQALRVLLVDDNADGVDTLAMLFRTWGHEVFTAYDGAAGLDAALLHKPDVAFLDIGLPRMNGYDLAQAIRRELKDAAPLLAAVTGYGQSDDRRRAEASGFRYHLVKPVSPDDLLLVLREAAARLGRPVQSVRDGAPPTAGASLDGRGRAFDGRNESRTERRIVEDGRAHASGSDGDGSASG